MYQRFSRTRSRRHTIIFSNNAVMRWIRGRLYFMVQAVEMRNYQLVEVKFEIYFDLLLLGSYSNVCYNQRRFIKSISEFL